jgi:alpha-amylase/alpha-mannosidase (GH57 family)
MDRYICIHAHFYQPPRENPWLETIVRQDSAYPYHDWNERITAECYAPNAGARILDAEGRITRIVNNYSRISFNFGPTLLSWLEEKEPEVYQAILDADRESQQRFSGHGSAMAQAYNHMILPLANRADRYAQILWGLRDFEHRFKRQPEGMWLPETAVDLETLEILAELGIRFTVLSPYQAQRTRKMGGRWRNAAGGNLDPTVAYEQKLPSGRSIAVFFYDGPISRAVAFERLLARGEDLAEQLLCAFADGREWSQLVHIATDGETYGHHHHHGDMALAYALHHIESNGLAKLINYGEYLERHPPNHQVEIKEQTAWSCTHGVGRWWTDCGCNSGSHPDWNQAWRTPLRNALDWLRDTLASVYEEKARQYLTDPWAARNNYINVVLDRSEESLNRFLTTHCACEVSGEELVATLKLLELQRHAMLMYTSCGWFFDELSGIETVQILRYAGRAIQLAGEVCGDRLEAPFIEKLAEAKSNILKHGNGAVIYEKSVKLAMVNLEQVGAHYAISSLFEAYEERAQIHCYTVQRDDSQVLEAGKARLAVGRAQLTSDITRETALLTYGVLHLGDHNLNAGVHAFQGKSTYKELRAQVAEPFERADFPSIIRLLDQHFGESTYSLQSLFGDEQRKIVNLILESTLEEAAGAYRQVYQHNVALMRFLVGLGVPLPNVFRVTAEFVLNTNLRRAFEEEEMDLQRIQSLLDAAEREAVPLDTAGLGYALGQAVENLMMKLRRSPEDIALLQKLEAVAKLVLTLPFEVQLWRAQDTYYEMLQTVYREFTARTDEDARLWLSHFVTLGEHLSVHVPSS